MHKRVIGDCTLYLGDCLEVLPNIYPIDSVIVDPVWPNCPEGLLKGWENPRELLGKALSIVDSKRIVVHLRTDSDPRFLMAVPEKYKFFQSLWLGWVLPGNNGRKLWQDIAYAYGDPVKSVKGRRCIPGMCKKAQPIRKDFDHPCPRHPEHMKCLVNWWSDENETVLDPFMGAGTTGVACAKMGRKFIGIEIETKYFDIACERIEEAYRQPDLFVEKKPKLEQLEAEL